MSEKITQHRNGWSYLGEGLAWCLIWLGFGGCCYLTHRSDNAKPLIVIERSN